MDSEVCVCVLWRSQIRRVLHTTTICAWEGCGGTWESRHKKGQPNTPFIFPLGPYTCQTRTPALKQGPFRAFGASQNSYRTHLILWDRELLLLFVVKFVAKPRLVEMPLWSFLGFNVLAFTALIPHHKPPQAQGRPLWEAPATLGHLGMTWCLVPKIFKGTRPLKAKFLLQTSKSLPAWFTFQSCVATTGMLKANQICGLAVFLKAAAQPAAGNPPKLHSCGSDTSLGLRFSWNLFDVQLHLSDRWTVKDNLARNKGVEGHWHLYHLKTLNLLEMLVWAGNIQVEVKLPSRYCQWIPNIWTGQSHSVNQAV